jgi:hypothetical protein
MMRRTASLMFPPVHSWCRECVAARCSVVGVLPFLGFPSRLFLNVAYGSGRSAAWLARLVRDQEVGGSNPLAPTILFGSGPETWVTYDGDGDRVQKSSGKLYWYGIGAKILDESDLSANFTNEYVFFGGKRIATRNVSSDAIYYYAEDILGSSRTEVQDGQNSPCFDPDFYPFGGERNITNTCPQNYKFEGNGSGKMPTIEIFDQIDDRLSFDLVDVLATIGPFSTGLDWYLAEFQLGVFHPKAPDTQDVEPWVLALWRAVEGSKTPMRASWETLSEFARHVRRTDSCLILALEAGAPPPNEPLDLNGDDFEIAVQAVDSTFWAITTRNQALMESVASRFSDTKIVERTERYH